MDTVIKRIEIDLYSPTAYEIIKAQQGDNNSRIIKFVLYDQGNPYTIPDNISIKLEGHRGDNSSFAPKDCNVTNNIISVTLDSDVLCEAGTVEAKIVMYDTDSILSTIPFKIHVQKNPCEKNKIEKKKKSLIDGLIQNIEKIKTCLDKKANIESPTLTGTPKASTASAGTNNTQIATTAFTQTAVNNHNTSSTAHSDIRNLISGLNTRLNALADSDDTTLDQLSEIVAYIKSNRSLIENVTTNKVNVSDIIDNLTSTATNKPLSAKQGKILNDLINTLTATVSNKVDKVEGKGLSTNDYTDEEKNKVASIFGGTVTGVKGNAESEYRNGNVNITPNDIGALSTTGGTVTGRTEFTKGTYVHNFTNANSRDIFVKVCTIKIKQGWADSPIMFDVIGRVYDGGSIYVKFQGNQGNDPGLAAFCYSGILYGTPYIHNSNTSTWDIYLNCRPYDCISITSIKMNNYQYDKTDITWTSEFVDSVPTSSIEATLMEYNITASKSKFAENAPTKTGDGATGTWNINVNGQSGLSKKILNALTIVNEDGTTENREITFGVDDNTYTATRLKVYGKNGRIDFIFANLINNIAFYSIKNLEGGSVDLGTSGYKWKNIYASNGVIQTSDRNEKNTIKELSEEQATGLILGSKLCTYKMNDGTSGRTHWGMISQDLEKLLESLGMTSIDFAGFIKSPKIRIITEDENGNPLEKPIEEVVEGEYSYGLRYEEFISPLIKVVQILWKKVIMLEEENIILKKENVELKEKIQNMESRLEKLERKLNI